jgi:hypothetical protein
MQRVRHAWFACAAAVLAIAAAPSSSVAQATPATMAGTWDACFRVDSASRAGTTADGVCLALAFDLALSCGRPTVTYQLADYWPYRQGSATDTTRLHYSVVGDTLEFGGRIVRVAPVSGDITERCTVSSDDGSLFGTGTIEADSVTGRWGTMTFSSDGPIGRFVLRRR